MYKKSSKGWLKHLDFMLLDLVCQQIAFVIAYICRHGFVNPYDDRAYQNIAIVLMLVQIAVLFFFNTFKNVLKRGYYQEFAITLKQEGMVMLLTTFYMFVLQRSERYSRIIILLSGLFYVCIAYPVRIIWKRYLRKRKVISRSNSMVIITTKDMLSTVIDNIRTFQYADCYINGIAILDADRVGQKIHGISIVADQKSLIEYVCREWVDEVFINLPRHKKLPAHTMDQFLEMGVTVHTKLAKAHKTLEKEQFVEQLGDYTVLTTSVNTATQQQLMAKRLLDILGGLLGCLGTLILTVFLAPAIYIKSPGPIFFKQTRIGKGGKKFQIYKFRSMYMDAEERKKELMEQNRVKDGMMFKLDFDPRIIGSRRLEDGTVKKGIGNFIRDYSLDEFPQFINVLKGEMSLVGTRPPTVDEWDKYELHHRVRLATKPGLTGMWQISGRSNIVDFEKVVELDKKYITEWSIGLDLRILCKTVMVVFKREGSM